MTVLRCPGSEGTRPKMTAVAENQVEPAHGRESVSRWPGDESRFLRNRGESVRSSGSPRPPGRRSLKVWPPADLQPSSYGWDNETAMNQASQLRAREHQ